MYHWWGVSGCGWYRRKYTTRFYVSGLYLDLYVNRQEAQAITVMGLRLRTEQKAGTLSYLMCQTEPQRVSGNGNVRKWFREFCGVSPWFECFWLFLSPRLSRWGQWFRLEPQHGHWGVVQKYQMCKRRVSFLHSWGFPWGYGKWSQILNTLGDDFVDEGRPWPVMRQKDTEVLFWRT